MKSNQTLLTALLAMGLLATIQAGLGEAITIEHKEDDDAI